MFQATRLRVQLPSGTLVEVPAGPAQRLLTPIVERKGCHPWTPFKHARAEVLLVDAESLTELRQQLEALQELIGGHLKGIETAEEALNARDTLDQ